ncbi:MAG TPA: anion permease [Kineosporiaceae bacterium]|nr:anion permease [Kineosporiaceae bacterium]
MDLLLLSVIAVIALALLFDFSNGFHDAANSIATVVATRAMPARLAVGFSAVCNFAAYFFVGTAVANTVAKIVKPGTESVAVVFAALLGAIAWNYLTWFFGMPSSSSHAVIGGLVGAGISAGGLHAISWPSVEKTALFIVISPLVAFVIAALVTPFVMGLQKLTGWHDNSRPFKALQLATAAAMSFGHGANDAQKTMGVMAALLAGAGYLHGASGNIPVPEWVALAAYAAIALGTMWGGWRIIETVGLKLTHLNARTGATANLGATVAIFGGTDLGIPLSTTHAATFSVVGAGAAARRGIGLRTIGEMVLTWVGTIPATAAVGWLVYRVTQLPKPASVIGVSVVVVVFLGAIGWAMRNSLGARQLEEELASAAEREKSSAAPLSAKDLASSGVPAA